MGQPQGKNCNNLSPFPQPCWKKNQRNRL